MINYLYVDMNSYFASVEQQERPELRGRPLGIVPTWTRATCCIAASIEAKKFGVKTGTAVPDAKKICPPIRFVLARHQVYVQYHQRIVEAVESAVHVTRICSIDEMAARLMGPERQPEAARRIAARIKKTIAERIGPFVRCSVGGGPNMWLAKVATDVEPGPDTLTLVRPDDLPHRLYHLALTDLPGIGRRMGARLNAAGITTIERLCSLSETDMQRVWASKVMGTVWWCQLRGMDLPSRLTRRQSVGHSHVLAPEFRTHEKAFEVMAHLIQKAGRRLRRLEYCANRLTLSVRFVGGGRWKREIKLPGISDTLNLVRCAAAMWPRQPIATPLKVSMRLTDLQPQHLAEPLFEQQRRDNQLARTMDAIHLRYGAQSIVCGSMLEARESAPTRISFTQIPDAKLDFD